MRSAVGALFSLRIMGTEEDKRRGRGNRWASRPSGLQDCVVDAGDENVNDAHIVDQFTVHNYTQ